MKHSSTSILPRLFKSSARQRSIFDSVSSSTHCWKRRWQVWYEGNRSGRSFQRAPERKIHKIPFSTARSSHRGRPRPSARACAVGRSGSIKAHCSSCNSSRRGIAISRWSPGKTVFHIKRLFGIFETASRNLRDRPLAACWAYSLFDPSRTCHYCMRSFTRDSPDSNPKPVLRLSGIDCDKI